MSVPNSSGLFKTSKEHYHKYSLPLFLKSLGKYVCCFRNQEKFLAAKQVEYIIFAVCFMPLWPRSVLSPIYLPERLKAINRLAA